MYNSHIKHTICLNVPPPKYTHTHMHTKALYCICSLAVCVFFSHQYVTAIFPCSFITSNLWFLKDAGVPQYTNLMFVLIDV